MTTSLFILTSRSYDHRDECVLEYYGHSPEHGSILVSFSNEKPCFFMPAKTSIQLSSRFSRNELTLKDLDGDPVDVVYASSKKELRQIALELRQQGITSYESDILPERRFTMERFIHAEMQLSGSYTQYDSYRHYTNPHASPCTIEPDFRIASLDIETSIKDNSILSIGIYCYAHHEVQRLIFIQGSGESNEERIYCVTEADLLRTFLKYWKQLDADIVIGWNLINFDLHYILNRCKHYMIPCTFGRNGALLRLQEKGFASTAEVPGRVILDGPVVLRTAFYNFSQYSLDYISKEVLGSGKLLSGSHRAEDIQKAFETDQELFIEYNLLDCQLVCEIFKKLHLIEHLVQRSRLTGLPLHSVSYSTAAFDHVYLPRLHRKGFVAPNRQDIAYTQASSGGFVLSPKAGIHNAVALFDFKSLYPSIIRTFGIDPLSKALHENDPHDTPSGHSFSRSDHILPEVIASLLEQRQKAKQASDVHLSQAIKILMNSFYGVLGSSSCRFYHPDLPSAITKTGQWILKESVAMFTQRGFPVLYGDTDSLFVSLEHCSSSCVEKASELSAEMTEAWHIRLSEEFSVSSHLSLEFEKLYHHFVIPIARIGTEGAKKRYAGIRSDNDELEFVGLEQVRSDWTQLAKDFQTELYRRVLLEEPFDDWILSMVASLRAGELDHKLVYSKRIRKPLHTYTKNIPPHVRAARMLDKARRRVSYVITKHGPVPTSLLTDAPDYDHYVSRQLAPIADSILPLINESFDPGGIKQLSLF